MLTEYRSHYNILNVKENAALPEIKKAFRSLSMIYHPDKNETSIDSHNTYCLILNAYKILSNSKTKAEYDNFLEKSFFIKNYYSEEKSLLRLSEEHSTNYDLLNQINITLWEIEELIDTNKINMDLVNNSYTVRQYILMIISFLDKWILEPGGFKDYFMESRKLAEIDPRRYVKLLEGTNLWGQHIPFTDLKDYFYDIRKRANKFITMFSKREMNGTGVDVNLIENITEYHNMAIHYLSYLIQISEENPDIPGYQYSHERYKFDYKNI